ARSGGQGRAPGGPQRPPCRRTDPGGRHPRCRFRGGLGRRDRPHGERTGGGGGTRVSSRRRVGHERRRAGVAPGVAAFRAAASASKRTWDADRTAAGERGGGLWLVEGTVIG